eukprot:11157441-Alexandrium_andersonii.AAC.1
MAAPRLPGGVRVATGEVLQRSGTVPERLPVAFQCGSDGLRSRPVAILREAGLNDAGGAEGRG